MIISLSGAMGVSVFLSIATLLNQIVKPSYGDQSDQNAINAEIGYMRESLKTPSQIGKNFLRCSTSKGNFDASLAKNFFGRLSILIPGRLAKIQMQKGLKRYHFGTFFRPKILGTLTYGTKKILHRVSKVQRRGSTGSPLFIFNLFVHQKRSKSIMLLYFYWN